METVLDAVGLSELNRMSKRQVSGASVNLQILIFICGRLPIQLLYQVLNFGMIVSSALMIWKGLMFATGSESPIVVVLR